MNEEIGNFLIKFTTEGFDKVEKQLQQINKSVENLGDSFDKGAKKGESFFGALAKWDTTVGILKSSFRALKEEITSVFETSKDMSRLFQMEESLRVEARVLERFGLIAEANNGQASDAKSFFNTVNKLVTRASKPGLTWSTKDQQDLLVAGIDWQYQQGVSGELNRDAFLQALRTAFLKANADPLNQMEKLTLLSQYVPQESLFSFFNSKGEDFDSLMEWANQNLVYSKNPEKLKDAQMLNLVKLEWGQIKKDIDLEFSGPLAELLKALEPLKEPLKDLAHQFGDWVDENKETIAQKIVDGVKWLKQKLPTMWDNFVNVLSVIGEVVSNIYDWIKKEGVVGKTWNSVKMAFDAAKIGTNLFTGNFTEAQKQLAEMDKKYLTPGSEEGGYLGNLARSIVGVPKVPSTRQVVTMVKNYENNVTVKPGMYTREVKVHPTRSLGIAASKPTR